MGTFTITQVSEGTGSTAGWGCLKSGNGFFVSKEGYALAIREDLSEIVKMPAFARQMGDIIDYRAMDYYRRRYHEGLE